MMSDPCITLSSYNPVGDGKTDDSAKVQAAISAAIAQGVRLIGEPKRYAVHGLQAIGRLDFDGAGATFVLDSSAYPADTILYSTVAQGAQIPFIGAIAAQADTLVCGPAASTIAAGSVVKVALGTDPYDSTQPHFGAVCSVLANNDGTIQIDRVLPYAIAGTSHWIAPITTANNGSSIRNLNFDYTVPVENVALWIDSATNFVVENVSGRCGGVMVQATYCDRGDLRNVCGDLQATTPAGGRLLGGWQARGIDGRNLSATLQSDSSAAFLESWCMEWDVDLKIDVHCPNAAQNNLVHVAGGSSDIRIRSLAIDSVAPVLVVGSGSNPADVLLGDVDIRGPLPINLPLYLMDGALSINGQRRGALTQATLNIPLVANMTNTSALCDGVVRRI